MAKRRQPRSTEPARPAGPSRVAGHRAKLWLATISTVVGVATGMFTLRDQVFPSESGSAGAMSASGYQEHVGRICDEVNANDRLRAHEDSKLRVGLPRAQSTIDQRNLLLDAARRTTARDGQTLASFIGLMAPTALASVRHDTGMAWNRNLTRVRGYAQRLDGAGTRGELVAALVHLSTLRPLIAADHVKVAAGLERLGAAECDLKPQRVTRTFTLPPPRAEHEPRPHHHQHATDQPSVTGKGTPPAQTPSPRLPTGPRAGPLRIVPSQPGVNTPMPARPPVNTPMPARPLVQPNSANTPGASGGAGGASGSGG
jgi:hypothetical protein